MSDAAQGVIMLVVFFAAVVAVGWVMRGRLTDIAQAGRGADDDAVRRSVDQHAGARRAA